LFQFYFRCNHSFTVTTVLWMTCSAVWHYWFHCWSDAQFIIRHLKTVSAAAPCSSELSTNQMSRFHDYLILTFAKLRSAFVLKLRRQLLNCRHFISVSIGRCCKPDAVYAVTLIRWRVSLYIFKCVHTVSYIGACVRFTIHRARVWSLSFAIFFQQESAVNKVKCFIRV